MSRTRREPGFTLIELLLVLFVVTLLAALVAPIVTGGIQRAKESTLKEDLYVIRKAIDDYHADTGAYPRDLDALVAKRYLRKVPVDPLTETRESWDLVREVVPSGEPGIVDIRSGSVEADSAGVPYKDW